MIFDNLKVVILEWRSVKQENLSKFLNNMAYKTVTSMRDCIIKRKFM